MADSCESLESQDPRPRTQDRRWCIVGLGNPGLRYRQTRHNAGFMAVDRAARRWGAQEFRERGKSMRSHAEFEGKAVLLVKPQTYMNLSGTALREMMAQGESERMKLVVVYDDFHLPLGKLRIRPRGSAGGHHGVESIIENLGGDEFLRLRLGIADENLGQDAVAFVLQPFPKAAAPVVDEMLEKSVDALESLISAGVDRAMALFN